MLRLAGGGRLALAVTFLGSAGRADAPVVVSSRLGGSPTRVVMLRLAGGGGLALAVTVAAGGMLVGVAVGWVEGGRRWG
jgi:hypothetical protein